MHFAIHLYDNSVLGAWKVQVFENDTVIHVNYKNANLWKRHTHYVFRL